MVETNLVDFKKGLALSLKSVYSEVVSKKSCMQLYLTWEDNMNKIQTTVGSIIQRVFKESNESVRRVVWIGAGGSFGGFYAAQYFMTRNAVTFSSEMFTSNEFVMRRQHMLGMILWQLSAQCEVLRNLRGGQGC